MRKRWWVALFVAELLGAGEAQPSSAERPWGFDASGGVSTYALGAVNDSLRSLDQSVGTNFGSIDGGSSFGAALRFWATEDLLLRFAAEKNSAVATDADRRFDIGTIDATLGAIYYLPTRSPLRFGGGVAAGVAWIRGRLEGSQLSFDTRGSGPDLRATIEALWRHDSGWFLSGSAGYRYAVVPEVRFTGEGSGMRADFSGGVLRLAAGYDERADSR
jgi:hypothetical protein